MLKIVFYMPSFAGGGAERNSVLVANEFTRLGHKVSIVVDNPSGPNKKSLLDDVKIISLNGSKHFDHIFSLRKHIKNIKPDIIFARVGLSNIKVLFSTIFCISWKNLIISYENLYEPSAKTGGRLTYVLSFFLTRITGATIAVSEDVKSELVNRFKASRKRIHVLHNPVDLQWIHQQAIETKPSWLEGKQYILSVGRLIYQKDYPTLLKAFAQIAGYCDLDLVILGDGPKRKEIESLVLELNLSGRVHLPGYLDNPFSVYQGAELFVLSSVFEGFGNVLIEALALGIPVVSTRCPGGPKEILDNGNYGKLVPVGDPNALADAILSTLVNPVDSSSLRLRAKDFSIEHIAEKYLSLLSVRSPSKIL
ncbi:glycosyltransferase [Desulfonatronovibrio magnus]|uniref:glycosyltransferase n=1 Tax=Desulfonatronovibrio magnus TaxID=698827 RepID=UPI0005EB4E3A|nr:glycosyltransferase [Desulfonatronovibrio magnus]